MSQKDRNRPRGDVRRVQRQQGGGQSRPPQSQAQSAPASGSVGAVQPGAQAVALEHPHPGAATYIRIAVVLAVITAVEVAVYYLDTIRPILVPTLLLLSWLKFALVVAFYMHLRFDSHVFRNLFLFGLAVAVTVLLAFLALNSYHGAVPVPGVV